MPQIRQFELLEDLKPGQSATAILLSWNGGRYVRTRERIVLFDFVGQYGHRGQRGYGFHSAESGRWEAAGGLRDHVQNWLPA